MSWSNYQVVFWHTPNARRLDWTWQESRETIQYKHPVTDPQMKKNQRER